METGKCSLFSLFKILCLFGFDELIKNRGVESLKLQWKRKAYKQLMKNVRLNEVCITPQVNNAMGAKVKKQLNLTGRLREGFTDI